MEQAAEGSGDRELGDLMGHINVFDIAVREVVIKLAWILSAPEVRNFLFCWCLQAMAKVQQTRRCCKLKEPTCLKNVPMQYMIYCYPMGPWPFSG